MPSSEFYEWMLYYNECPFDADYIAAARVSAVLAEINRDPKRRSQPYSPIDFMPVIKKASDNNAVVDAMYAWFHLMGGKNG